MDRDIHDIYDVILKIIITVYGTLFLNFIGIDEEIDEILNVEIITLKGSKLYLDFLCRLKNGKLQHIEFQYPEAEPKHYNRFFRYNILVEGRNLERTETLIFNHGCKTKEEKPERMGETKCFMPKQFYLGDVDFESHIQNINIKLNHIRN